MIKRFRKGLVVGKFSPLHFGHEALIEHAALHCDQVLILSYSNPEFPKCDRATRERWLKSRFSQFEVVVVDQKRLNELASPMGPVFWTIPHNDAGDTSHREFCSWLLTTVIGTSVDAVFSSETYGQGFADHLTKHFNQKLGTKFKVEHVLFDLERTQVPTSGTQLRARTLAPKQYISSNVYASLMPRLVLLGGESSGKTTLAKALASELSTAWVSEYGREMWDKTNGDLRYEDMLHIATTQVKSEQVLARRFGNRLLVCDTSPLTTLFYCRHMFNGRVHHALRELANRQYDFTVVCAPTIPFDQDGTREGNGLREKQHQWYLTQLMERGVKYIVVDGSVEERIAQVLEYVKEVL